MLGWKIRTPELDQTMPSFSLEWLRELKAVYRACIVPQPLRHLVLSAFDAGANLVGVDWRTVEVLRLHFPDS